MNGSNVKRDWFGHAKKRRLFKKVALTNRVHVSIVGWWHSTVKCHSIWRHVDGFVTWKSFQDWCAVVFWTGRWRVYHYSDVIMSAMASQITSLTIAYSIVYQGADQRKHQNCESLAFVRRIHQWPVNSPHKGPVTRKMFPFDDVIMHIGRWLTGSWSKSKFLMSGEFRRILVEHIQFLGKCRVGTLLRVWWEQSAGIKGSMKYGIRNKIIHAIITAIRKKE